jgi:hypothetical protein
MSKLCVLLPVVHPETVGDLKLVDARESSAVMDK